MKLPPYYIPRSEKHGSLVIAAYWALADKAAQFREMASDPYFRRGAD